MAPRFSVARLLPAALAVTLLVPVLADPELNPAVTLFVAAASGAVLCVVATRAAHRRLSTRVLVALCSLGGLAVWLTVAALRSIDPLVSFMGAISQHTGAALWLVIAAWTLAAALLSDRNALREMLAVTSVTGALFAVLGVVEALSTGARSWGSAAGPFENSSSLGTYLAVAIIAAVGWALAARSKHARHTAIGCALVIPVGMVAAESRTAFIGAASAAVVMGLIHLGPKMRLRVQAIALALPLFGLGATAALIAASVGSLGATATNAVGALGTQRDAIWRSAAAQVAQSPLAGSGPEQYSAWVQWSFVGGLLRYNGTYDPHNAIAGIALGGGMIGVVLWTAFAIATLMVLLGVIERTGRPRALIAIASIPVALMASTLFAWLTPAAAIVCAALVGAVMTSDTPREGETASGAGAPRMATIGAVVIACLAVSVAAIPMLATEWRYVGSEQLDAADYAALHARWPDPAYATAAVDAVLAGNGTIADVTAMLETAEGHAGYHVDLALREIFLAQDELSRDPASWPGFAGSIETGALADPASALWFTIGAAQADAIGLDAERDEYAGRALALELDLGPQERRYLQDLIDSD